jgi:hypothetical protein
MWAGTIVRSLRGARRPTIEAGVQQSLSMCTLTANDAPIPVTVIHLFVRVSNCLWAFLFPSNVKSDSKLISSVPYIGRNRSSNFFPGAGETAFTNIWSSVDLVWRWQNWHQQQQSETALNSAIVRKSKDGQSNGANATPDA